MDTLGIENLKAVATDATIIAQDLVDAAKDGVQLTDTVVIFKDLGKIQNVASKAKQALAEIKDLEPDETAELVEHVVAATGLADYGAAAKIKGSLRLVARAHRLVAEAIDIVQDTRELFS